MHFFRKHAGIIIAIAACCSLLTACGESKVVQCTKLIQIVNKGSSLVNYYNKDNRNAETTNNLASALTNTAKELDALELKDTRLKGLKAGLSKAFRELSQSLSDISKVLDTSKNSASTLEGKEQIKKAKGDMDKAGKAAKKAAENQDTFTAKLADYCSSNR